MRTRIYEATAMRYLRIHQACGSVYLDHAANALGPWTWVAQTAAPSWVTTVNATLFVGVFGFDGGAAPPSSQPAVFKSVNTCP